MKLSSIGDVFMATPVAAALRKALPDAYIAWVVERKAADALLGNPYLDEVFVLNRPSGRRALTEGAGFLRNVFVMGRELHKRRFDVCLDLQGLLRSAVVCLISGARRRIGFADAGEGSSRAYHDKHAPRGGELSAQQRNLNLLETIGIYSTDTAMHMPVADSDRDFACAFLQELGLADSRVVAFCAATTLPNKHWVRENWSRLADLISERYGVRSLIFGSHADVRLAKSIASEARSQPAIAAGRTTLKQAAALLENCEAIIAVDTGLLYMAAALGKPVVGLFGPTELHCELDDRLFTLIYKDYPCSPCLRHPTCADVGCMQAISAEEVCEAVGRWLT